RGARGGCGRLCDQGRTGCRAGRRGRERRTARVPVAARSAPGGDSRARTRRPAVAERYLLVGVRLLRARRVTRLCAMKGARVHAEMSSNKGWRSEQLSLSSEGEGMTWRSLRGE